MDIWLPLAAREAGQLGNVIAVIALDKYNPPLGIGSTAVLNKTGVLLARKKGEMTMNRQQTGSTILLSTRETLGYPDCPTPRYLPGKSFLTHHMPVSMSLPLLLQAYLVFFLIFSCIMYLLPSQVYNCLQSNK